jgi:hypothetical protein
VDNCLASAKSTCNDFAASDEHDNIAEMYKQIYFIMCGQSDENGNDINTITN